MHLPKIFSTTVTALDRCNLIDSNLSLRVMLYKFENCSYTGGRLGFKSFNTVEPV